MCKNQIKNRIQRLEREVFALDMKEVLDSADYSLMQTMNDEINKLKYELKKVNSNERS